MPPVRTTVETTDMTHQRSAASTTVVAFVIIVVVVVAGMGYLAYSLPPQQAPQTSTVTSQQQSAGVEIMNDYLHHLMQVQSKNVSAIVSEYEDDAVLEWEGATSGFGGTYHGLANMTAAYNGILPRLNGLTLTNVTGVASISNGTALVNGSFYISWAFNPATNDCPPNVSNVFEGQVVVAISFAPSANGWLISNEIWNFQTPTSSGICA
jgi:hypothetical protein